MKTTWSEDAERILDGGTGGLSPELIAACRAGGRALEKWVRRTEGQAEYSREEGKIWTALVEDHLL